MFRMFIVSLLVASLWGERAFALTCRELSVSEAYQAYATIFVGKLINTNSVVEIDKESSFYRLHGIEQKHRVTYLKFKISKLWKGKKVKAVRFLHQGISQPLPFQKDRVYIIFLNSQHQPLQGEIPSIGACTPYQDIGIGNGLLVLDLLDTLAGEKVKTFQKNRSPDSILLQKLGV